VTPVTFRQMFTFKTTIEGNTRSYFKWFSESPYQAACLSICSTSNQLRRLPQHNRHLAARSS